MSRAREIRDPIHGFVRLDGRECDLIDTPIFQRLRRIHQLAMAYMVYPGALHSRFDHTLGVREVAGRMCHRLQIENDHARLINFAALLHDLGHGPFSHVSESILDSLSSNGLEKAAGKKEKIHELITQRIIYRQKDLDFALSARDRDEVVDLLKRGLDEGLHRDIISGPLDADKQDYLLRDSHFCGVSYGVFDIDQLHHTFCRGRENNDERLMVTEDGIHALEQFVLAKYYLTTQVYRHKVRLITDQMLIRAIKLGVEVDKIRTLEALYRFNDTDDYLNNYLLWDDQQLTVELLKTEYESTLGGAMFRRLVDRRLFKVIFQIPLADRQFEGSPIQSALPEQFDDLREDLEKRIAEELSVRLNNQVNYHDVIVHFYSIQSARKQSRNDEDPIKIDTAKGPILFETRSKLFESINSGMAEEFLECYAPCDLRDDMKKRQLRDEMKDFTIRLLQERYDPQAILPLDLSSREKAPSRFPE